MEDIKTNFEKIMAKFNESVTHSAPKKLHFEYLDDTANETERASKKRRLNEVELNGSASTSTNSIVSSSSTTPHSPWEARRLKTDLIEAQSRISKLKQEVERQHSLRKELEILYDSKVNELKKQCDFSASKVADVEKHLQVLRKREQAAKQELTKAQTQLNIQKGNYEDELHQLQKEKMEIENNAREIQLLMENDLSDYRRHVEKLEMDLDFVSKQAEDTKNELEEYKERAAAYDKLKLEYEQQSKELQTANSRIKELEYQIASYEDWKQITSNAQARIARIPDMDKEIERLRNNNKNLLDLLGNKLLLEEQVHDLEKRLAREEGGRKEAIELKVKISHIELELKEWIKVAQDHCLSDSIICPMTLRSRIEELLQDDIIKANENRNSKSEAKSMESELLDYKRKCDVYEKNIEDLNVALKRHKNLKERVQRKLLLVSKERDCYKQLLENFEKDLTVTNANNADANGGDAQLRVRLDMLEKALVGYKDMCANLEKQLPAVQSIENADGYEHLKKELDTLRLENERLLRRKEELELELEQHSIKGDYYYNKCKVLHLAKNPAAEAYEYSNNIIEKLQAEIERLKRHIRKLEEDNEMTQNRLNETTTNEQQRTEQLTVNIKELSTLRLELESANLKMQKMKECFKQTSNELREVCYMLFGYRIDRVGNSSNYKLSSMYAESPDDYLNFRLNETLHVLDMLETPYSATLKTLIDTQLVGNKSLPVFLSTLTLELFQRSTVTIS